MIRECFFFLTLYTKFGKLPDIMKIAIAKERGIIKENSNHSRLL